MPMLPRVKSSNQDKDIAAAEKRGLEDFELKVQDDKTQIQQVLPWHNNWQDSTFFFIYLFFICDTVHFAAMTTKHFLPICMVTE